VPGEQQEFGADAGRVCLDLMSTLSGRDSAVPVERLSDAGSVGAWLLAVGLARRRVAVSDDDVRRARDLRAAVSDVVHAAMADRTPSPAPVRAVNRAAEVPVPPARLVVRGPRLRRADAGLGVAEALALVARDAIDLVTGPQVHRLRECAAPDCSGIFVDASRGRRRRWCSTARCGNRTRVATHRARRRSPVPEV